MRIYRRRQSKWIPLYPSLMMYLKQEPFQPTRTLPCGAVVQIQDLRHRPMSEGTNKTKLKDTLRTLNEQWASLHSQWRDSASDSLDREAIQPANDAVRLAILAVEQLSEAISKAKRDCDAG